MTCIFTKLYGERNSGATYLSKLIDKNFATDIMRSGMNIDPRALRLILQKFKSKERMAVKSRIWDEDHERILYSDYGWVHTAPPVDVIRAAPHSSSTLFIIITKHPAFFLRSLRENPDNPMLKEEDISFDKFLVTPWPIAKRDNLGENVLESPIELWNKKMQKCVELLEVAPNVLHIRYEDLLSDFSAQLDRIAEHIPAISASYGNVMRSNRASDNLRLEDYQRKYKYQKIKTEFKKRDLEYIYRKADSDLMNKLGYREIG